MKKSAKELFREIPFPFLPIRFTVILFIFFFFVKNFLPIFYASIFTGTHVAHACVNNDLCKILAKYREKEI